MLATSTVTTSLDDLIVWPDGESHEATWCYRSELQGYSHLSDDYKVISAGTDAWSKFIAWEEAAYAEAYALFPDEPQFPSWDELPIKDLWQEDALEAHVQTSANWDELHVATTGDTYLDRDPITGVISYDHLGDQDVSDIPY